MDTEFMFCSTGVLSLWFRSLAFWGAKPRSRRLYERAKQNRTFLRFNDTSCGALPLNKFMRIHEPSSDQCKCCFCDAHTSKLGCSTSRYVPIAPSSQLCLPLWWTAKNSLVLECAP